MIDEIKENDQVLLMKSFDQGNMKIVRAAKDCIIHYGKLHFETTNLIGHKYGTYWEIIDKTMILIEDFEAFDEELSSTVTEKLATFSEKSQYSQEKVIAKKKKLNHANIVAVIKPTLMLLHQMLYARDKLGGLRQDLLAQIITAANLQNGAKTLIYDHGMGVITCAVMTRCMPDGKCIQLVPDNEFICSSRRALDMLNIRGDDLKDKIYGISVFDLFKIVRGTDNFNYENDILKAKDEEQIERLSRLDTHTTRDRPSGEKSSPQTNETDKTELISNIRKKRAKREARHEERIKAATIIKSKTVDSLILIGQQDHPLYLLKMTYEYLSPSRQFVIYCDCLDALLDCYTYLKSNHLAISLSLSTSWLRKYQVLKDRTRPEMSISGSVGYLLTGTKAFCGPGPQDTPVSGAAPGESTSTLEVAPSDPTSSSEATTGSSDGQVINVLNP